MAKVMLSIVFVLGIIYIVPFLVYGVFTKITDLKPPEGTSPAQFLFSIFISKVGTAIAFVLIFYLALTTFGQQWLLYAFIWWLMFVVGEIGQAIGPNYSWKEAAAGIISETIYFPLAAFIIKTIL